MRMTKTGVLTPIDRLAPIIVRSSFGESKRRFYDIRNPIFFGNLLILTLKKLWSVVLQVIRKIFLTIMCYECTDSSNKKQLVTLHWVDLHMNV